MKLGWVAVALLILPIAFARNINIAETSIEMEGNGISVQSAITIESEETIGNLTLILAPNPDDIEITIDNEKKNCLIQAEFARCGNVSPGIHTINLSYETSYPVATSGENTIFRYTDRLPYPAESQQVSLKLPVGYIIPREKDKDESFYISPTPKDVYSDGQRIILYWEQTGQEMAISVVARKVIGPPIAWISATILAVIATAIITIWFIAKERTPRTKKTAKKKTILVPGFIENEQKVVDFLKQNGETWQKQIQQATGFSKAKVSRIIRNLETRGVVTKTVYGNTNKIALKK